MFTKVAVASLLIVRALGAAVDVSAPSFNNWNNIQSLDNFDNFYGQSNFNGGNNAQIVVIKEQEVVCRSVQIEVIQQKLVILREMAKRIITEQICEVETQTIVLEQFSSGFSDFGSDISRKSGKQVGYDSNISNRINQISDSNGNLSSDDLGFNGSDVGKNTVVAQGNNWNDSTGPSAVQNAKNAAKKANQASGKKNSGSSASSTVASEVASTTSEAAASSTSEAVSAEITASASAEASSSAASAEATTTD
ncbi:hypothetical protein C8J56DRAFT_1019264 [Mycena floridula]|nr:hypothetical protein C8J56DRAFT_1019264 [Mycena floridula]